MKLENKTDRELLKLYEDYVGIKDGLDSKAPPEAIAAYKEALKRGQRKKELWEKGIKLD
jgi:hypothetical protein